MFLLVSMATLALLTAPLQQGGPPALPESLQALFTKGVQALRAGRFAEAEKTFVSVLQKGGRLPYVYNNLGIVHQQLGDHSQAIRSFREAIRLDPRYAAPRALIGASLLARGEIPEALRQLQSAVALLPREPQARLQLAKAHERAGDLPAAIDQYRTLSAMFPQEPEYAYQLGRSYRKLSEWSYQQISDLHPRSARVYQVLGQHFLLQGKLDLAIHAFQQAAHADPRLPEIHLALAQIYIDSGKLEEARREVELELELTPESKAAIDLKSRLGSAP